jgi:uncharacterized protein (DUF58 family)|tara:strand:+ start:381 stop:1319 length:939 start_codon:yes stop_codon:yes gene_type:complete
MEQKQFDLEKYRDLEHLELYARQVVEGFITGLHKSPYHGFSVEFSEHRIYNPGESTKNIDWKLFGRTDRLYTKRYEEETNLRCHIAIDTSGSMFFPLDRMWDNQSPNKVLFSAISALGIMQLMRTQRDAVGLTLFGENDFKAQAKSTRQHHKAIAVELNKVLQGFQKDKPNSKTSMAESLHLMAERIPRRSLVLLFSDLFEMQENEEEIFDALQHLKYNKHELVLFWTTDHEQELDFNFEERPYRFVDMEDGSVIKMNPTEIKKAYKKEVKAFTERLKMKCLQYKIDLVEADVSQGYYSVLQGYLVKRKKMY